MKRSSWGRIALAVLAVVLFVIVANMLFPPRDPRVSSGAPSIPDNVGIIGTASPKSSKAANSLWFHKPVGGDVDVRPTSFPFQTVFTKWKDSSYLFVNGSTLEAYSSPELSPVATFPGERLPITVEDITVSENHENVLLSAHDGNSSLLLANAFGESIATEAIAGPVTSLIIGRSVTDDGTALVATKEIADARDEVCINSAQMIGHTEKSCLPVEADPAFVEFHRDGLSALTFGFSDGKPRCAFLQNDGDSWLVSDQSFVPELTELKQDSIAYHFSLAGKVFVLTDSGLVVSFAYPTGDCSLTDVEKTSIQSFAHGSLVSISNDRELVNVVFYQDGDETSGQYVATFNAFDPQQHVGPWQIPPDVSDPTGYESHQKVDTVFLEGEPIEELRGEK